MCTNASASTTSSYWNNTGMQIYGEWFDIAYVQTVNT